MTMRSIPRNDLKRQFFANLTAQNPPFLLKDKYFLQWAEV